MAKINDALPVNLAFKASIRADGEITRVTLTQMDQCIYLTVPQVVTLVSELKRYLAKLKKDHPNG